MLANSGAGLVIVEATHVSGTAASPTAASGSTPTTTRRRWRAWSRIAVASAPPSSASSSRMPAARPRRSGRGRAAGRLGRAADPWQTIGAVGDSVRRGLAYAARDDRSRHRARARGVRSRGASARCASASTRSSCTWRTAIWRTASCRRSPTNAPTSTAARSRTACAFRSSSRARGARRGAEGHAARRAHHRQRLARRRAHARRRGGYRQGAQGRAGSTSSDVSSGGVTADVAQPDRAGYNVPSPSA